MCTEQLPPGGYPIAVKYIPYHIISYQYITHLLETEISTQPCRYLPACQRACPSSGPDQSGVGLW